jgi:hypothetical protein
VWRAVRVSGNGEADGLSIALLVATVTLVTTAAVAMRFVPSQ